MIRFVVDSTACCPREYCEKNKITVVPLSVFVGEREYMEGAPDTFSPIFEDAFTNKIIPRTSLPPTQAFVNAFESILREGDEVFCLTIASTVSGTYNNAYLAARMSSDPSRITVADSGALCQEIFLLIMELVERASAGMTRKQLEAALPSLRDRADLRFVPETLEYLRRGGRISLLSAAFGNILKIKPVLRFENGRLTCAKKILGESKGIGVLLDSIPADITRLGILKVYESKYYDRMKAAALEKFPNVPYFEGCVSPVVGAHIGIAYGFCWMR